MILMGECFVDDHLFADNFHVFHILYVTAYYVVQHSALLRTIDV